MMKFFGKRYHSAAYIDAELTQTPVGLQCCRCLEIIQPEDDGWMVPFVQVGKPMLDTPYHRACYMRGIIGSVAHQKFQCSCFVPGSSCRDDPNLTKRQAAEAALAYWEKRE